MRLFQARCEEDGGIAEHSNSARRRYSQSSTDGPSHFAVLLRHCARKLDEAGFMSRPPRRPFPTLAAPCPNPGACSEPRHAIRRVEAAASSANIAKRKWAGQVTISAQETFYKMFIVRASVSAAASTVERTLKKKKKQLPNNNRCRTAHV